MCDKSFDHEVKWKQSYARLSCSSYGYTGKYMDGTCINWSAARIKKGKMPSTEDVIEWSISMVPWMCPIEKRRERPNLLWKDTCKRDATKAGQKEGYIINKAPWRKKINYSRWRDKSGTKKRKIILWNQPLYRQFGSAMYTVCHVMYGHWHVMYGHLSVYSME